MNWRIGSNALTAVALSAPLATVVAITSFLVGNYGAVFLLAVCTYGFATWAMLVPAIYVFVAFGLGAYVPVWAGVVLRAAGWNVGGAAVFALSTALLWDEMREGHGTGPATQSPAPAFRNRAGR